MLSDITDVRVCSTLRLAASALVVVPRRWTLRRRYTGVGVSFALDDPDSNVTWRIMKLDAGSIEWQLLVGSNLSSLSESSVAIDFNFTDNALLPPVYQDIRREPPPPPPVFAVDAQESPPDYTAVIVGSVLGALSLIGLIIYGIWRWRRNRTQAVLTM